MVYFANYSLQRLRWKIRMRDITLYLKCKRHAFIAQQENTTVISCHCLFLPQKPSKMEWNQKKGEIGIPMLIKVDIMCNEYSNWMFALNVWIECLHWCSTCIFTLNVRIEFLNRMVNVRHASVIYTFEYSRGKFR